MMMVIITVFILFCVIYEFIKRDEFGFCKDSVKGLMESTKGL